MQNNIKLCHEWSESPDLTMLQVDSTFLHTISKHTVSAKIKLYLSFTLLHSRPSVKCTDGLNQGRWYIRVRPRRCGCLITWFCYHLIAKPGKRQPHFCDVTYMQLQENTFEMISARNQPFNSKLILSCLSNSVRNWLRYNNTILYQLL